MSPLDTVMRGCSSSRGAHGTANPGADEGGLVLFHLCLPARIAKIFGQGSTRCSPCQGKFLPLFKPGILDIQHQPLTSTASFWPLDETQLIVPWTIRCSPLCPRVQPRHGCRQGRYGSSKKRRARAISALGECDSTSPMAISAPTCKRRIS